MNNTIQQESKKEKKLKLILLKMKTDNCTNDEICNFAWYFWKYS